MNIRSLHTVCAGVVTVALSLVSGTSRAEPDACAVGAFEGATAYQGACAGCGTDRSSWSTAANAATAACQGSCTGSCSASTAAWDGCSFDGTSNGYICNSYCTAPDVSVGTCDGCGTDQSSWASARDAAVAACQTSCTGTCSVSASASDQCSYDSITNGYRCNSTCVCAAVIADAGVPDAPPPPPPAPDASVGGSGSTGGSTGDPSPSPEESSSSDGGSCEAGPQDSLHLVSLFALVGVVVIGLRRRRK